MDGCSYAIEVGFEVGAAEKTICDGRDFLQRDGEDIRDGGSLGERIKQRRGKSFRIHQVPGTIEGQ